MNEPREELPVWHIVSTQGKMEEMKEVKEEFLRNHNGNAQGGMKENERI